MSSLPQKIRNRFNAFRAPLPLADFDDYDEYWQSRTGYEGEPEIRERWKIAVEQIPDGATVLDVGCGTGGFLDYLKSQRPNVKASGVDVSAQGVEIVKAAGFDAWVVNLGQDEIPGTYEYVTCFETLEHVHEAERMLVAMREAFTERLIISIPNIGYIESRIRLGLFGRFPNTTIILHQKEHIRHWTYQDFLAWSGHFDLEVLEVRGQWGRAFTPWERWPKLWSPSVVYILGHDR